MLLPSRSWCRRLKIKLELKVANCLCQISPRFDFFATPDDYLYILQVMQTDVDVREQGDKLVLKNFTIENVKSEKMQPDPNKWVLLHKYMLVFLNYWSQFCQLVVISTLLFTDSKQSGNLTEARMCMSRWYYRKEGFLRPSMNYSRQSCVTLMTTSCDSVLARTNSMLVVHMATWPKKGLPMLSLS